MPTLTVLSSEIRQLDGLYSLNDLHKAAGASPKHRPNQFMRLDTIKALIVEIENCADLRISSTKSTRGRNGGTYVCKELVYAYAMWISPLFHLKVIRAFDAMRPHEGQQPRMPFMPGEPGKRYLVAVHDGGQYHAKPIPNDAYVLTIAQIVRSLGSAMDFPLTPQQLAEISASASQRLACVLTTQ